MLGIFTSEVHPPSSLTGCEHQASMLQTQRVHLSSFSPSAALCQPGTRSEMSSATALIKTLTWRHGYVKMWAQDSTFKSSCTAVAITIGF